MTRRIALAAALCGAAVLQVPVLADVSGDRIAAMIQRLASPQYAGRRTGEPGNEKAALWIASEFRRLGLKPVGTSKQFDSKAAMDGSGYFQPFDFPVGVKPGPKCALSAVLSGRKSTLRVGKDWVPFAGSGAGLAEGSVAFVGYGVKAIDPERDDYGDFDVKGKVVVALAGLPVANPTTLQSMAGGIRRKAQAARDRGAVALIIVATKGQALTMVSERGSDVGIPVATVNEGVAERWLTASGKQLSDLRKQLAAAPSPVDLPVKISVEADTARVTVATANVVGLLPGSDPSLKEQIVAVGGHMDHLGMGGGGSLSGGGKPVLHPGADDNASGTAAVIELACHFTSLPAKPKRSLLFMAFTGEEQGLLGSAYYVRKPILPLERTIAMVNMDMVGRMKNNVLSVSGAGTSTAWRPMLTEFNSTAYFNMQMGDSGFGGSDHQSFYTGKVPVLFFFTGTHPDYHRGTDTADKINVLDAERVTQLAARCISTVADKAERPDYVEAGQTQQPGRRRFRVTMGIVPDYGGPETAGLAITGVTPGSQAEKAGLKGGDVITSIGGKSVKGMEDYMAALEASKAGDVIDVVLRRAGQSVTLKVTLAGARN
jgi:hypothetical protein